MMKKLLVVLAVLAMASVANAALKISVNGVVDPPDTTIILLPSQWVELDIWSDGTTPPFANQEFYLKVEGLGSLDIEHEGGWARNFVNPPGHSSDEELDSIFFVDTGVILVDLAIVAVPPVAIPAGTAADRIWFHCEGQPGDVTLTLYGVLLGVTTVFDTQVIHQVPEPMTLALLSIGGLFLRRRK